MRVSYNGYYVSFPRMRLGFDSLYPHQRKDLSASLGLFSGAHRRGEPVGSDEVGAERKQRSIYASDFPRRRPESSKSCKDLCSPYTRTKKNPQLVWGFFLIGSRLITGYLRNRLRRPLGDRGEQSYWRHRRVLLCFRCRI